jgi:hypothetical protein
LRIAREFERPWKQSLAFRRELNRSIRPEEKKETKLPLELSDLGGKPRLGEVELRRCARKGSFLRDGSKQDGQSRIQDEVHFSATYATRAGKLWSGRQ